MTAEDIEQLFFDAAKAELLMPPVMQRSKTTLWPETEAKDWLNFANERTEVRLTATNEQIDRYEKAIFLALKLPHPVDRKIVWLRANNCSWKRMAKYLRKDYRTVQRMHRQSLVWLAKWMNEHGSK